MMNMTEKMIIYRDTETAKQKGHLHKSKSVYLSVYFVRIFYSLAIIFSLPNIFQRKLTVPEFKN